MCMLSMHRFSARAGTCMGTMVDRCSPQLAVDSSRAVANNFLAVLRLTFASARRATGTSSAVHRPRPPSRCRSGGKPLGFLNPWIYKNAAAFNDVTHGVNDEGSKTHGGFAASTGWDPATGVGTPNFAAMLKAL